MYSFSSAGETEISCRTAKSPSTFPAQDVTIAASPGASRILTFFWDDAALNRSFTIRSFLSFSKYEGASEGIWSTNRNLTPFSASSLIAAAVSGSIDFAPDTITS